ncbi:MAG TPA: hypothetical protein VF108_10355, partial [Actinomycetota bacterium]
MSQARGVDLSRVWLATSVIGIAAGGALAASGRSGAADVAWAVTTVVALLSLLREVGGGLLRRHAGVDVI